MSNLDEPTQPDCNTSLDVLASRLYSFESIAIASCIARLKHLYRNKCLATRSKCLTSNKKLLVTSALLVVTMLAIRI